MKLTKAIIFLFVFSLSQIVSAEPDKLDFVKSHPIKQEESSKFGLIQLTDDGSVFLNGKLFLQGNSEKDDFDTTIDYSIADTQPDKKSPWVEVLAHGRKYKHQSVSRLILVGRSQNPVFYRVLDLTGKEPYISESFGKDGHWADELKNTRWGKDKTFIEMKYGTVYLYTKGKKVEGPFAY